MAYSFRSSMAGKQLQLALNGNAISTLKKKLQQGIKLRKCAKISHVSAEVSAKELLIFCLCYHNLVIIYTSRIKCLLLLQN